MVGGRYRLEEVLGAGGMGVVWRAYDERLHRAVAVKEIRYPSVVTAEERSDLTQRAMIEARSAARLDHPGIVAVHDVVEEDDRPWIIMRLVAGRSLDQVVRQDGPLDIATTANLGVALVDALTHAHAAGVVHRDVKPSNVLVQPDGRVLLTDFSIALVLGVGTLTKTGVLLGSPGYIAPERMLGGATGPAADLFGLGATLYFAVEGRGPFDAAEPLAGLFATANQPHPRPVRAGALEPILDGLLAKDPSERLTTEDARAALASAAAPSTAPPSTASPMSSAAPLPPTLPDIHVQETDASPVPPAPPTVPAQPASPLPPTVADIDIPVTDATPVVPVPPTAPTEAEPPGDVPTLQEVDVPTAIVDPPPAQPPTVPTDPPVDPTPPRIVPAQKPTVLDLGPTAPLEHPVKPERRKRRAAVVAAGAVVIVLAAATALGDFLSKDTKDTHTGGPGPTATLVESAGPSPTPDAMLTASAVPSASPSALASASGTPKPARTSPTPRRTTKSSSPKPRAQAITANFTIADQKLSANCDPSVTSVTTTMTATITVVNYPVTVEYWVVGNRYGPWKNTITMTSRTKTIVYHPTFDPQYEYTYHFYLEVLSPMSAKSATVPLQVEFCPS
jgi:serine/threonine protein kinase